MIIVVGMPDTKTAAILRAARDYLHLLGHAKRTLKNSHGGVCLFGALNQAMTGNPNNFPLDQQGNDTPLNVPRRHLARALGVEFDAYDTVVGGGPHLHNFLVRWNNAEERTQAEVEEALEKAAAIAESEA